MGWAFSVRIEIKRRSLAIVEKRWKSDALEILKNGGMNASSLLI